MVSVGQSGVCRAVGGISFYLFIRQGSARVKGVWSSSLVDSGVDGADSSSRR